MMSLAQAGHLSIAAQQVTARREDQARFLNRQLSLPVSTMSQ